MRFRKARRTQNNAALALFKYVSPGFLHTAGTRLIAGREITWTDIYDLRPLVMVSENLARELWGTPSAAVGKRLRQDRGMPWQEVIGVVQDVRAKRDSGDGARQSCIGRLMSRSLRRPRRPPVTRAVTFVIRSERAGTEGLLNQVRQAVWSVNASLPWPRSAPCGRSTMSPWRPLLSHW